MQLHDLYDHLRRGGAATLNHPARYSVAGGAVIAPARYAGRNGSEFVFETRFVDDEFRRTVLIDSKQSQSNRAEEGLLAARRDGGAAARIPTIEVHYVGREPLADLSLPHRAFDAHVRFATQDGAPVVKRPWYQALRDATHADLSPVFVTAPVALAFGGWDSSRGSGQLRLRGLLVSELFGVVDERDDRLSRRSGARLDPLGQDFKITPEQFERLIEVQREHLSPNLVEKLHKELDAARKKKVETISASGLNLGGIPPSLESPFGVSVPEVRRARTFSLAGLRRLRFGGDADEDVAARGALLAMLMLGVAYADADPDLRAYCDVSAPSAQTLLDDEPVDVDLSITACEAFLAAAVERLPERLGWGGQVQILAGDEALNRGAQDVSDAQV
ncbi:MAG: type I-G CRISPR-associated RAMP protein Csb1/Cas7g [Solirubrobacteraceae bacterium]